MRRLASPMGSHPLLLRSGSTTTARSTPRSPSVATSRRASVASWEVRRLGFQSCFLVPRLLSLLIPLASCRVRSPRLHQRQVGARQPVAGQPPLSRSSVEAASIVPSLLFSFASPYRIVPFSILCWACRLKALPRDASGRRPGRLDLDVKRDAAAPPRDANARRRSTRSELELQAPSTRVLRPGKDGLASHRRPSPAALALDGSSSFLPGDVLVPSSTAFALRFCALPLSSTSVACCSSSDETLDLSRAEVETAGPLPLRPSSVSFIPSSLDCSHISADFPLPRS